MSQETETNFGWWADRPDREDRPSAWATSSYQPIAQRPRSIWRAGALMVGLMFAFVLAMVMLFAR